MFQRLSAAIVSILKDAALKSRHYDRLFFKVYPYMYEPGQLHLLTQYVQRAARVPGCFIEVGCAYGATTVFLNRFMDGEHIEREYYALDTFSGFVDEDVKYEVESRGKPLSLKSWFLDNKKSWFDRSMLYHGVNRVKSVQCDVREFDFSAIGPIAFCLLDVDLYLPIKNVLPKIHGALSPGGIIIVDDCKPQDLWDGALQAYEEYIREKGIPKDIVAEKLGIIVK